MYPCIVHRNFHEFFCGLFILSLMKMLSCHHMYTNSHLVAMGTGIPMAKPHNRAAFFKTTSNFKHLWQYIFFHAFYQLFLWKHVLIALLKNKVIAQLPWKQVS